MRNLPGGRATEGTLIVRTLFAALAACLTTPAFALTITFAKIDKGAVHVKGKGAPPFSTITWERMAVATASKSGTFKFATGVLPADCVGDVAAGADPESAVISGCTRAGSPGLIVVDANGVTLGPYVRVSEYLSRDAVAFVTADRTVLVPFFPTDFELFSEPSYYYESSDCSGPQLLLDNGIGMVRASGETAEGKISYPRSPARKITTHSRLSSPSPGSDCGPNQTPIGARCCCGSPGCLTPSSALACDEGTIDPSKVAFPLAVEVR